MFLFKIKLQLTFDKQDTLHGQMIAYELPHKYIDRQILPNLRIQLKLFLLKINQKEKIILTF